MLKSLLVSALLVLTTTSAMALDAFPKGPDANLTPGELCMYPDSRRYPENIAYCERDVSRETKAEAFEEYDQIGYRTRTMKRQAFKIDHYIPLCMGGSNSIKNLWPQHQSVYTITDPLEQKICEKMADGVMLQKDAVEMIKFGKANLDQVDELLEKLEAM